MYGIPCLYSVLEQFKDFPKCFLCMRRCPIWLLSFGWLICWCGGGMFERFDNLDRLMLVVAGSVVYGFCSYYFCLFRHWICV
jgi:hypothetical protein